MPVEHPVYPVNLIVDGRRCLVVGGGPVALHKVRGLVEAGARVTVVGQELDPEIVELARGAATGDADVVAEARPYRPGEAAGYRLVVAATGDPAANQRIYDEAEAAGVWINSADDPERCTVTLELGQILLPSYPTPEGPDAFEYNGTNGFMLTLDISSKDFAKAASN